MIKNTLEFNERGLFKSRDIFGSHKLRGYKTIYFSIHLRGWRFPSPIYLWVKNFSTSSVSFRNRKFSSVSEIDVAVKEYLEELSTYSSKFNRNFKE